MIDIINSQNKNLLRTMLNSRNTIAVSLFITLLVGLLTVALIALAVQPHSVMDLLEPTTVELRSQSGNVVHTQVSRLNTIAMPDTLESGSYELYVDGQYQDSIFIEGRQNKEAKPVETEGLSRVEVKNINGAQAIKWGKPKVNDRLFNLEIGPYTQLMGQWVNQQKVLFTEINIAMFFGAILTGILLMTFNISALITAVVRKDNNMINYFKYGWKASSIIMIAAIIWSFILALTLLPMLITMEVFEIPYSAEMMYGFVVIAALILFWKIVMAITGEEMEDKRITVLLTIVFLVSMLGFIHQKPLIVIILLVLATHVIIPGMVSVTAQQIKISKDEEGKTEAWKESLL